MAAACSTCGVLLVLALSLQGCQQPTTTTTTSTTIAPITETTSTTSTSTTTTTTTTSKAWKPAECFVAPTYAADAVSVLAGIPFGSAYSRRLGQNETLLLDAYFPPAADKRTARPVIVLLHGGGFTQGSRTTDGMPFFAREFARRGFVAVSIEYRLKTMGEVWTSPQGMLQAVQDAEADTGMAIRFLQSKAADWRTDTSRVALFGYSAGAITSLYYAYVPDTPQGIGSPLGKGISGVISISGELKSQVYCESINTTTLEPQGCLVNSPPFPDYTNRIDVGEVPVVMLHGTLDNCVPYVNAVAVHDRATEIGVHSDMVIVHGADHLTIIQQLQDPSTDYLLNAIRFATGMLDLTGLPCPLPADDVVV